MLMHPSRSRQGKHIRFRFVFQSRHDLQVGNGGCAGAFHAIEGWRFADLKLALEVFMWIHNKPPADAEAPSVEGKAYEKRSRREDGPISIRGMLCAHMGGELMALSAMAISRLKVADVRSISVFTRLANIIFSLDGPNPLDAYADQQDCRALNSLRTLPRNRRSVKKRPEDMPHRHVAYAPKELCRQFKAHRTSSPLDK